MPNLCNGWSNHAEYGRFPLSRCISPPSPASPACPSFFTNSAKAAHIPMARSLADSGLRLISRCPPVYAPRLRGQLRW